MRFHALVTAVMVGLVVPVADNFSRPAAAQSQAIASVAPPIGTFRDGNWTITVSVQNGVYRYSAYDLRTGQSSICAEPRLPTKVVSVFIPGIRETPNTG
jgi:hypothetical protein